MSILLFGRHEPILQRGAFAKDKTRPSRNAHEGQLYGRADKLRLLKKHENVGVQTVAKVVVNEDEAPALLHIFEAYAAGNRIPDIVRELDDKGIKNRGNLFTVNSIYFMLQQEKYTGVYTFNGETFTHIYPAIIPKELHQIVRKRVDANKTGKHVTGVDCILMGKCFCGYCGRQLRSAACTTTDGTILRYYSCPYSKKDPDCHNQSVRKEALEALLPRL